MRMRHAKLSLAPLAAVLVATGGMTGAAIGAETDSAAGNGDDVDITRGVEPRESVREDRFTFLDLDEDGYITREELRRDLPLLRSAFSSLDENNDGRLSEEEYVKFSDAE